MDVGWTLSRHRRDDSGRGVHSADAPVLTVGHENVAGRIDRDAVWKYGLPVCRKPVPRAAARYRFDGRRARAPDGAVE